VTLDPDPFIIPRLLVEITRLHPRSGAICGIRGPGAINSEVLNGRPLPRFLSLSWFPSTESSLSQALARISHWDNSRCFSPPMTYFFSCFRAPERQIIWTAAPLCFPILFLCLRPVALPGLLGSNFLVFDVNEFCFYCRSATQGFAHRLPSFGEHPPTFLEFFSGPLACYPFFLLAH